MTNFTNSIMFKNFIITTAEVTQQCYNGFSGMTFIPDFLLAMFQVNMTLLAQAAYIVFTSDLNFRKYGTSIEAEDNMPFKLSEMYKSRMLHIKRFVTDYIANTIWGILCGVFLWH